MPFVEDLAAETLAHREWGLIDINCAEQAGCFRSIADSYMEAFSSECWKAAARGRAQHSGQYNLEDTSPVDRLFNPEQVEHWDDGREKREEQTSRGYVQFVEKLRNYVFCSFGGIRSTRARYTTYFLACMSADGNWLRDLT